MSGEGGCALQIPERRVDERWVAIGMRQEVWEHMARLKEDRRCNAEGSRVGVRAVVGWQCGQHPLRFI